jgi:hypothetical protein
LELIAVFEKSFQFVLGIDLGSSDLPSFSVTSLASVQFQNGFDELTNSQHLVACRSCTASVVNEPLAIPQQTQSGDLANDVLSHEGVEFFQRLLHQRMTTRAVGETVLL